MYQYKSYQYQPYPVHSDYNNYYHAHYEIPHTYFPEYQTTGDSTKNSSESDINKGKDGDFIPTQY